MGKGVQAAPAAPDPQLTSQAQGAANVDTALAQSFLNQTNVASPFGNVTFTPTGETFSVGTGENQRDVPRFQQNIELAPEQQALFRLQNQIGLDSLNLGQRQIGNISDALSGPFDPVAGRVPLPTDFSADRQRVEDALFNRGSRRLDERFGRQREDLTAQLASQGINSGTEAYSRAFDELSDAENDAFQSLSDQAVLAGGQEQSRLFGMDLSGRARSFEEAAALRAQPVQELAALLGTSPGVQGPQFSAAPQTGIAPTDVVGPINTQFQSQLANFNAQNQARAQTLGSVFGLGGSLGAAAILSDRRVKRDIVHVGWLRDLPLYAFRYVGSAVRQVGVMAQDVARTKPDAVTERDGILHVNYGRL